jgi:hypothetical protein
MIKDELTRAVFNHEITTLLAVDKDVRRLWMRVNPAQGTITYTVTVNGGRSTCETLSLARAIDVYNGLKKETAA